MENYDEKLQVNKMNLIHVRTAGPKRHADKQVKVGQNRTYFLLNSGSQFGQKTLCCYAECTLEKGTFAYEKGLLQFNVKLHPQGTLKLNEVQCISKTTHPSKPKNPKYM